VSAAIDFVDPQKRVMWISYEGRGDELEANLRAYGVEYVPDFRHGRVGITYTLKAAPEDAVTLVDILTMRCGVNKGHEDAFHGALYRVQEVQHVPEEALP
jgi:hypothetical protein